MACTCPFAVREVRSARLTKLLDDIPSGVNAISRATCSRVWSLTCSITACRY